jgi:hypothetical protein
MISYFVNCKYKMPKLDSLLFINLEWGADGVGIHILTGVNIWRIPFGLQLVPAGIMILGLLTVRVSPGLKDEFVRTVIYSSFLNRNHRDGLLRLVDMKKR